MEQRLAWIRSQYRPPARDGTADFATQPYEQLAAVYRQAGQDNQARKVAIARRRPSQVRESQPVPQGRQLAAGQDHRIRLPDVAGRRGPGRRLRGLCGLSFLAQHHHLMVPVGDTEGLHPAPSATKCTSSYPCFYPVGYAVNTVIPIINVHQADYWGPDG